MAAAHQPLTQIRDQLGFRSVTSAEAAINRVIHQRERQMEFAAHTALEVERVDAMFTEAYKKAMRGDLKAMETAVMLQDKRASLVDEQAPAQLSDQFDRTIEALDLKGADKAAVEAGRTVAKQIDHVLVHGTPHERTKALYLLPHLMNVLKELGATPAARGELEEEVKTEVKTKDKVNPLLELQRQVEKKAEGTKSGPF